MLEFTFVVCEPVKYLINSHCLSQYRRSNLAWGLEAKQEALFSFIHQIEGMFFCLKLGENQ